MLKTPTYVVPYRILSTRFVPWALNDDDDEADVVDEDNKNY